MYKMQFFKYKRINAQSNLKFDCIEYKQTFNNRQIYSPGNSNPSGT